MPANTLRRVIVDLEDYVCAYPELVTSGGKGSLVRLQFAEALREAPDKWNFAKGNRDTIEGRYFLGMGDSFRPDGGERAPLRHAVVRRRPLPRDRRPDRRRAAEARAA